MSASTPTHLTGHAIRVELEDEDTRGFASRSSQGGELFEVRYSGQFFAEHGLIVRDDDAPSSSCHRMHGRAAQSWAYEPDPTPPWVAWTSTHDPR